MKSKILVGLFLVVVILTSGTEVKSHPPPWAPAHGYREQVGFIYFPEHNFYYDFHREGYFYLEGENWRFAFELPLIFAPIDMRIARKVYYREFCDYPWKFNKYHRKNIWIHRDDFWGRHDNHYFDKHDNDRGRDRDRDRRDDRHGKKNKDEKHGNHGRGR